MFKHASDMPQHFLWFVRLLQIALLFFRELLAPRRYRLVNPLKGAKAYDGRGYSTVQPGQSDVAHRPAASACDLVHSQDDLICVGIVGARASWPPASGAHYDVLPTSP
jgi:hypothetical protein